MIELKASRNKYTCAETWESEVPPEDIFHITNILRSSAYDSALSSLFLSTFEVNGEVHEPSDMCSDGTGGSITSIIVPHLMRLSVRKSPQSR